MKKQYELNHHAWEKFYLAVTELVEGRGDVRSRLNDAYENHLWGLHRDEFPEDLWRDYEWIVQNLTCNQARWKRDTLLTAPLSRMRNKTGSKIAKKIFSVYSSLEEKRVEEYAESERRYRR